MPAWMAAVAGHPGLLPGPGKKPVVVDSKRWRESRSFLDCHIRGTRLEHQAEKYYSRPI